MRPRGLIVLLAVVLALGAFIWFYERELPGSEERRAMADRVLPGLVSDEVRSVRFERPGEEAVHLVRSEPATRAAAGDGEAGESGEPSGAGEPSGSDAETTGADAAAAEAAAAEPPDAEPPDTEPLWRYAAPDRFAGARADGHAVEDLLSALAALDRTRTLEDYDPEAVGLAPPRLRVVLELAGGERRALAMGGEVPASNDLVMARGDGDGPDGGLEEAFLVDRSIATDLDREAGEWRSRQVFPARRAEIEQVSLLGNGPEVVLERRETGVFWLGEPVHDLADRKTVDTLLDALTGLRVSRFLDPAGEDLGALDLEPPRGVITVRTVSGEPFRLEIGAPAPDGGGTVLRSGGALFVADTVLVRSLLRSPEQWQSRNLTERQIFEVEQVEVRGGGGEAMRLERAGTDWSRDGETISYTPVSELLFSLIEARAERLESAAALGLGAPERVIRITASPEGAEGSKVVEEIALHPARPDAGVGRVVPATVEGRAWALLLPAEAAEKLARNLARVRDARPVAAGAAPDPADTP